MASPTQSGPPTVADLRRWKGSKQLTDVYVESLEEARAASSAGIDMITVQDSLMSQEFRLAAPEAFIVVGLAYGAIVTTEDYLRAAFRALTQGGDAVWCAAGLGTIERLATEGIAVVGHVGLIPPRRTWTGGFRAVGTTASTALDVWRATRDLERAGAFAAEIEVVPAPVATEISSRTTLVMISMGSGSGCDAQYLFSTDILGTNSGHVPRHAKQFADLGQELERLQKLRINAYSAYVSEVNAGIFPDPTRLVPIPDAEMTTFLQELDRQS